MESALRPQSCFGSTARRLQSALVSAVNGGIAALSKSIAEQGIIDGVHVNLVQPGTVKTARRQKLFEKLAIQEGLKTTDYIDQATRPLRITRLGEPSDIAEAVGFSARSRRAGFSGQSWMWMEAKTRESSYPGKQTMPNNINKPPFTEETASLKVKAAEDTWNTRNPERVALAYTEDSEWRNRNEFLRGREEIRAFLRRKWAQELDYRLKKTLWCWTENRIAVTFEYEWHDSTGKWFRSYGNELWEFNDTGLMRRRIASINDAEIAEFERRLR